MARNPWAAALRPQSFPGPNPCARRIGLQPFCLVFEKRLRHGRNVSKCWGGGFQSKEADECSEVRNRLRPPLLWGLFQEEVPADISGFARNAVS